MLEFFQSHNGREIVEMEHMQGRYVVALDGDILQSFNHFLFEIEGSKTKVLENIGKIFLFPIEYFFVIGHVGFFFKRIDLLHAVIRRDHFGFLFGEIEGFWEHVFMFVVL